MKQENIYPSTPRPIESQHVLYLMSTQSRISSKAKDLRQVNVYKLFFLCENKLNLILH